MLQENVMIEEKRRPLADADWDRRYFSLTPRESSLARVTSADFDHTGRIFA